MLIYCVGYTYNINKTQYILQNITEKILNITYYWYHKIMTSNINIILNNLLLLIYCFYCLNLSHFKEITLKYNL